MLNLIDKMGRYVDEKWQDMRRDEVPLADLRAMRLIALSAATPPDVSHDIAQALIGAADISHAILHCPFRPASH